MRGVTIALAVDLLACQSPPASRAYSVEFGNELDSVVYVEMTHYDARQFSSDRPVGFSEALSDRTVVALLLLDEVEAVSSGGGWVTWRVVDQESRRMRCRGVLDFTTGDLQQRVALTRERCPAGSQEAGEK